MPDNETIMVQPGPKAAPGRVILWERDSAHPEGEVYIAAGQPGEPVEPVEVARTSEVEGHLRSGELVEAGSRASRRTAESESDREPASERQSAQTTEPPAEKQDARTSRRSDRE